MIVSWSIERIGPELLLMAFTDTAAFAFVSRASYFLDQLALSTQN